MDVSAVGASGAANTLGQVQVAMLRKSMDQALQNICYFYNRDVKESIEKLQVMIEPILTVILGTLMALIMVSILGPIFDLMTKIR